MSLKRAFAITGAVGLLATTMSVPTLASSHREAPLISRDPSADNTDLYAFVSPDKMYTVSIVANYTGFQEPAGGPNFYSFDPDVLYWIKVDNTGDGVEDITYTFRFTTNVANPNSFLYSGYGPIPGVPSNVTQTYEVQRNGVTVESGLEVPPPNIGPRTTPNYHTLAKDGTHALGSNGKVFAGQADDPFFADLGAIFDLGGLRPFNGAHLLPLPTKPGQDALAAFNVNSIAIQIPKSQLTNDGMAVTAPDASNAVIGIWAGASRPTLPVTTSATPAAVDWVQVSRLGNPLINEVLIPIGEKDEWNAANPADDGNYMSRYTDPELAAIINTIYPSLPDARTSGRSDLVLLLGQGVPGLNQTNSSDLYDMLRLNMGIAPTAHPSRMGVMAGDLAGWPNGRRLTDDVVDIALRAVADGYGTFLEDNFGLPNESPNNTIGDGCNSNDRAFQSKFPYVSNAWRGYPGGDYRHTPCSTDNQAPAVSSAAQTGSANAASAMRSQVGFVARVNGASRIAL
ncbi:MAG: hypothetical protein QOH61_17 [Chloroflexota bacterium]|jgi:hypothetical protein|nr:hypothetical protein [Chloroflexota bacterium]